MMRVMSTPIVAAIMYTTMFKPLLPNQTDKAYPKSTARQKIK